MIEILRFVVAGLALFVFTAGIFMHFLYRPPLLLELRLTAYSFLVVVSGCSIAVGVNALAQAPAGPALYVAAGVLAVASLLSAAAVVVAVRRHRSE